MSKPKIGKPVGLTLMGFRDNKGRVIGLDPKLTIADLLEMGIRVKIEPRNTPLKEHEFSHDPGKS